MNEIAVRKQPSRWRVRRAIVRKEMFNIVQHNYYLISLLVPLLMSFIFAILFGALDRSSEVSLIIYDEGNSNLAKSLTAVPEIIVQHSASETNLMDTLTDVTGGILIPADFDTAVANGQQPSLTVFINSDSRSAMQTELRRVISDQVWLSQYETAPALIDWEDHSSGDDAFAAFSSDNYLLLTLLTLSIVMAGTIVLPQLMVEEKEKSTLPVLLATPAKYTDLIFGKAIAIFLISLVLGTAVLALNSGFVGNWQITLSATMLMIFFSIGIGILFGIWVDTKSHCNEYSMILMFGLNIPIWFTAVSFDTLSPILQFLLRLVPTTYFANILQHSLTSTSAPTQIGWDFLILTAAVIVVFILVWRRVQQRPQWLT